MFEFPYISKICWRTLAYVLETVKRLRSHHQSANSSTRANRSQEAFALLSFNAHLVHMVLSLCPTVGYYSLKDKELYT